MGNKTPGWIVRLQSQSGMLLRAEYLSRNPGTTTMAVREANWASFKLLFPADERYPEDIRLAHFDSREGAEAVAMSIIAEKPKLVGLLEVEECWIKRCKRCHDCLCGEGRRSP